VAIRRDEPNGLLDRVTRVTRVTLVPSDLLDPHDPIDLVAPVTAESEQAPSAYMRIDHERRSSS
jgi:hypothetical protein